MYSIVQQLDPEKKGLALIFFFLIVTAAQGVYLSGLFQEVNIYAVIVIVFTLLSILFGILTLANHDSLKINKNIIMNFLLINITTAGNWFGFLFAIKYIEPAIASAILYAVGPIFVLIINATILQKKNVNRKDLFVSLGIFLSLIMSVMVIISGKSATGTLAIQHIVIGIAMSVLCGLSVTTNIIVAKKLNNASVSPRQIMAFRFILLILISLFLVETSSLVDTVKNLYVELTIIAVFGYLLPLYALQVGLMLVETLKASFSMAISPLIFIGIQIFDSRLHFSVESLICVILCVYFIIYGIYTKHVKT